MYTKSCKRNRRSEEFYYFMISKLFWIRAVKDIIWKRRFLKELISIAEGFRSERMLRGAIVLWRFRARKHNNSRRWLKSADKYCAKRLKQLGLIFFRASAVYSLPSLYNKLSLSNFYPKKNDKKKTLRASYNSIYDQV